MAAAVVYLFLVGALCVAIILDVYRKMMLE